MKKKKQDEKNENARKKIKTLKERMRKVLSTTAFDLNMKCGEVDTALLELFDEEYSLELKMTRKE